MKEKIQKNKNKILIVLVIIFSLSGVVVFADVASNNDNPEVVDNEAQVLKASLLSSKDNQDHDEKNVTGGFTNNETLANEDINDENIDFQSLELGVLKPQNIETLEKEANTLIEIEKEKKEAYTIMLAQIDRKIVPLKYEDIKFTNIGTLPASDVQIGISTADSFVNIRETPTEDGKILGKLYTNEAAAILSIENGWAQIESGSVKGYVHTDYLNTDLTKDQVIESIGIVKAKITADGLNVRQEASEDAEIITVVALDEKYSVIEILDDWIKISVNDSQGYVSKEFTELSVSFKQAISIEEELEIIRQREEAERKAAEEAARKKEAERKAADKKKAKQKTTKKSTSNTTTASNTSTSGSEHAAKEEIARRESGGSYSARNGKYIGRYQLSSSYLKGDHSAENQERTADRYVASRYGSWQKALAFWNANGWY